MAISDALVTGHEFKLERMQKELSNDQRARLEQIARDEFRMKQGEISTERTKAYEAWVKAEEAKIMKSKLFKDVLANRKAYKALTARCDKAGFVVSAQDSYGSRKELARLNTDGYRDQTAYPGIKARRAALHPDNNSCARALNEVLSVIWSMEKPFKECVALINKRVKAIK